MTEHRTRVKRETGRTGRGSRHEHVGGCAKRALQQLLHHRVHREVLHTASESEQSSTRERGERECAAAANTKPLTPAKYSPHELAARRWPTCTSPPQYGMYCKGKRVRTQPTVQTRADHFGVVVEVRVDFRVRGQQVVVVVEGGAPGVGRAQIGLP